MYGKNYEETEQMYDDVSEVIKNKYNVESTETGKLPDGTKAFRYIIQNDNEKTIGIISLAKENGYSGYWLSIFYTDAMNYVKKYASQYDDI